MSRYTLVFPHYTSVWEDDVQSKFEDEAELKALVVTRFVLPPSQVEITDKDSNGGWVDFTVWFDLGDDLTALRTETERVLRLCGDIEFLSVMDEAGHVLLTEEEF